MILLFLNGTVYTDVGPGPVSLVNVLESINIILGKVYTQVLPYLNQGRDILLILSVVSVFILYLQQDYGEITCPPVFRGNEIFYYLRQGCEVGFDLFQEQRVILADFETTDREESGRHASKVPVRTNVWARTQEYVETVVLSQLQKGF